MTTSRYSQSEFLSCRSLSPERRGNSGSRPDLASQHSATIVPVVFCPETASFQPHTARSKGMDKIVAETA